MNNHCKFKRKKPKRPEIDIIDQQENQQETAAQNLINISNFQDQFNNKNELNPESDIFNSVDFEENQSFIQNQPLKCSINLKSFPASNRNPKVSELQKFMDKKFIHQSRLLLKLYQPYKYQNQCLSPQFKNQKQTKSNQKKAKSFLTNSFKSDTVIVFKRQVVSESTDSGKSRKKQQKPFLINKKKFNSKVSQSIQKHSYKIDCSQNWMTKSLQLGQLSSKCTKGQKYTTIQRIKTLNNTAYFIPYSQARSSTKFDLNKNSGLISEFSQKRQTSFRKRQERNSNSFRKRFTFYKSQKCKVNHKFTF